MDILYNGIKDILFRADVRVQAPLKDTGRLGNILGRGLGISLLIEDVRRDTEYLLAPEAAASPWAGVAQFSSRAVTGREPTATNRLFGGLLGPSLRCQRGGRPCHYSCRSCR